MLEITLNVNGQQVGPEGFADAIKADLLRQISEKVKSDLHGVRCEIHGQEPAVKITMTSESNLEFELAGCCKEFEAIAGPLMEQSVQRMSD